MAKATRQLKLLTNIVSDVDILLKPQNANQRRRISKADLAQAQREFNELKKLHGELRKLESPKLVPKLKQKRGKQTRRGR